MNTFAPGQQAYSASPLTFPSEDQNQFDSVTQLYQNPTTFETTDWNTNVLSTINWLDFQDIEYAPSPWPSLDFGGGGSYAATAQSFDNQTPTDVAFNAVFRSPTQQFPGEEISTSQPHLDDASMLSLTTESLRNSTLTYEKPPEPGEYYVDGEAARLPRVKRRRISSKTTTHSWTPGVLEYSLDFPFDIRDTPSGKHNIDSQSYNEMSAAYEYHCLGAVGPFGVFAASQFPSQAAFGYLISLYFEDFQPALPMLHVSSFSKAAQHWLLLLAVAAIGSHFLEGEEADTFVLSIHEFIRRVLFAMEEDWSWMAISALNRIQIKILHAISTVYCDGEKFSALRPRLQVDLAAFAREEWSATVHSRARTYDSIEAEWQTWCESEAHRRAGYSAWLLDCMWTFHFHQPPMLALGDADQPLPCHESLWAADDVAEWKGLQAKFSSPPTLLDVLRKIYIDKTLSNEIGEFSRILLIHALFRRSWEVEAYFQQDLSHWTPTAQKESSTDVLPDTPIWLPSIPTFTKWRNSTCDCLDILHWDANAKIGAASGLEHPTVLHLHLARVVLLTPFRDLITVARFTANGNPETRSRAAYVKSRNAIRRWATQDQFKARLAMIHAGVLFWHVRRHSANGFYEPSSVALATLALWAFSAFSPRRPPSSRHDPETGRLAAQGGKISSAEIRKLQLDRVDTNSSDEEETEAEGDEEEGEEDEEEAMCDIILLDRPADDELVQNFVRRGYSMRPIMSGVGNLYAERGADRVLSQGKKLLTTFNDCWRIARYWVRVLEALAKSWKKEMHTQSG